MSHVGPGNFQRNAEHFGQHSAPPGPTGGSIPQAHAGEPAHLHDPVPAESAQPAHAAPPNHEVPDVEAMLNDAIEIVETARPAPLSTSIKLEGEPLLDLLYDARERLPEELRAARWLLRDREEHLESQRLEGEEIITAARSRAEYLVERTEVVRSAEQRAQRIISEAKAEARQMRRETEDFCDSRLASLETTLDRTRTIVATGRTRLQSAETLDLTDDVLEHHDGVPQTTQRQPPPAKPSADLFDQDLP